MTSQALLDDFVEKADRSLEKEGWVDNFVTYNKKTHLFTAWDTSQSIPLSEHKSWDEAYEAVLKYAKTIDDVWQPIVTAPNNKFILIKGDSGMMRENEYIIKAEYSSYYGRWQTVQHNAIHDEFPALPTHWMEVPK